MSVPNLTLQGGAFENFEGGPIAFGSLLMQLSHDENFASGSQVVAGLKLTIGLDANGNINPTVNVFSNDLLLPAGSYYTVYCYDASGVLVFGPQYWQLTLAPNPLNVATIVPLFPPGTGLSGGGGGGGGGGGTVTTVALTINSTSPSGIFTVTGSPITTAGALNINLAGTPGSLPFFSTSSVLSSSGSLVGIVRGSGAGFTASEISGDATTSGSNLLTLANVNSNIGSFVNASITVNSKGLITAAASGSGGGGGTGTVTSVGLTVNSTSPSGIFTVTGSPVTSLGVLNLNLAGNTGGLAFFSSSSVLSSSSALTGLVRGNGSSFSASEISGDATTSGSNLLTFNTVNANVGSFVNASFTVNAKGLVTAAASGSGGGGGSGTVTSVGLTVNSTSPSGIFTVTGSPVTSLGTLNINLAGTSGGFPFFSSSSVLTSTTALTGVVRGTGSGFTASEISGDATTSSSNVLTFKTVNANVGAFTSANITVNAKGLITAAANGSGGGSGTVTSVGLTINSTSPSGVFTVTGSPVTTAGTLNLNLSGTSGGLAFFSSSSVLSSSASLTGIVRGNGSGFTASEISGDGTTSGSNALTLATVNSNVGSFTNANITVNAKGLITAAANGAGGGGGGTVTSVALTVPSIMSVAGSPVTTAGTLAVTLATEAAGTVFAGPVSGGAATPTFRALVPSDYTVASVDVTNFSAAVTPTTLFAPVTSGQFLITWSADITTAATTSSSLGGTTGFQIVFVSPTDNVSKTTIPGNSIVSSDNTTGTAIGGSFGIYAKAGTNILYEFDYVSSGATAMVYELHIRCIAL